MTTPRSARMLRVKKDMAGVGRGPVMMTCMPAAHSPDVRADSSMYPERRVSLPMTTLCRCGPERKRIPAASPSRRATSAVMG